MDNHGMRELLDAARPRLEDYRRLKKAGLVPMDGDFFPSVHYPPITMYQPITEEALFETYTLPPDGCLICTCTSPFACAAACSATILPVRRGRRGKRPLPHRAGKGNGHLYAPAGDQLH